LKKAGALSHTGLKPSRLLMFNAFIAKCSSNNVQKFAKILEIKEIIV
jgi:hypothetical protein